MRRLVAFFSLIFALSPLAGAGPVEQEALRRVEQGALLLDVRTPGEFAGGHLQGAENIPYQEVVQALTARNVSKDTPIVLYCRSGRRASVAEQMLREAGYSNVFNGGGLVALQRELRRR